MAYKMLLLIVLLSACGKQGFLEPPIQETPGDEAILYPRSYPAP